MRVWIAALLCLMLVSSATAQPATAVLVLGDSISAGVAASSPFTTFPVVLSGLIGQPVVTVGSGRNLRGITRQWATLRPYSPVIVVIEIGLNDASGFGGDGMPVGDWLPAYRALITDMQAAGVGRIVVTTPPKPDDATLIDKAEPYAVAARSLVGPGVVVADLWSALDGCECISADGVHPTDAGHLIIAATIAAALDTRLWLPEIYA